MNSLPKLPSLPSLVKGSKPRKLSGMPAKRSDPEPDPLANVQYTGNVSDDSARELTALEEGYRERAKNEAKRFKDATDSEYWFAVCFQNREEVEAFLAGIGLDPTSKYVKGSDLIDALKNIS